MADQTENLELPYILPSQAQKHVTHNEALQRLDAVVQLVVQAEQATPPAAAAEGACYAVAASPTGAWSAKAGYLAFFQDGAWLFITPRIGWIGWFVDDARQKIWDGGAWLALSAVDTANFAVLGINASADSTNRLSLAAAASLFSHSGSGHQMKINKASTGDTGSLLFQTGWSGRAEMGLAGSDAFAIKVSGDGASWANALEIDATGVVALPHRPLVRASLGETTLTPPDGTMTGFATLSLVQGGFGLGAAVVGGGNRLVAPSGGFYLISLGVSSVAASAYSVSVLRNGTTVLLTIRDSDPGAASYSQSATALAYLDANDWIALSHSGGAELEFGYGKTELTMALI